MTGRPRTTGRTDHSVSVRLSDAERRTLTEAADRVGLSLSAYLRETALEAAWVAVRSGDVRRPQGRR